MPIYKLSCLHRGTPVHLSSEEGLLQDSLCWVQVITGQQLSPVQCFNMHSAFQTHHWDSPFCGSGIPSSCRWSLQFQSRYSLSFVQCWALNTWALCLLSTLALTYSPRQGDEQGLMTLLNTVTPLISTLASTRDHRTVPVVHQIEFSVSVEPVP